MNLIVIAFVTANAYVILYEHIEKYTGLYSKISFQTFVCRTL